MNDTTMQPNGAAHNQFRLPPAFPGGPNARELEPQAATVQPTGMAPAMEYQQLRQTQLPSWYRDPATLSADEQALKQRYVRGYLGEEKRQVIEAMLREQVVPKAASRSQAVAMLASLLGIKESSAIVYLQGLRLLTPLINRKVKPAKQQRQVRAGGSKQKAARQAGRQGLARVRKAKPAEATAATYPGGMGTLRTDLSRIDSILTTIRQTVEQLSPAGRQILAARMERGILE